MGHLQRRARVAVPAAPRRSCYRPSDPGCVRRGCGTRTASIRARWSGGMRCGDGRWPMAENYLVVDAFALDRLAGLLDRVRHGTASLAVPGPYVSSGIHLGFLVCWGADATHRGDAPVGPEGRSGGQVGCLGARRVRPVVGCRLSRLERDGSASVSAGCVSRFGLCRSSERW
jgi:hypothetical protein